MFNNGKLKKMNTVELRGNDAVDSGMITITYSAHSGTPTPLSFDFNRDDGYKCNFGVKSEYVRDLLIFLAENIGR